MGADGDDADGNHVVVPPPLDDDAAASRVMLEPLASGGAGSRPSLKRPPRPS